MKLPATTGACADRLYKIREEVAALNKKVEALDEEKKAIEKKLINELSKDDAGGIKGRLANASITTRKVPTIKAENWPAFYKHVLKTKDFSLMQRRLSEKAIQERWDAGEKVPGVDSFTVVKVSVTKL